MRWTAFSLLALSACTSPQPGIEVRTVEVPVETMIPCLDAADIPQMPERADTAAETDARNLLALVTPELLEWRQYGREALAAMERCATRVSD